MEYWCEYKRLLGVDFGEYSLKQYRYAKVYYRIVQEEFLNHQREKKMNKITRAIIMAAGKGTRMHPITETLPKPLIRVHGKRMIDTIIEALHEKWHL